jgi:signal peptidase I
VQPIAEQIASASLPAVLISLVLLTLARVALNAARAPFCQYLRETLESVLLALGLVFFVLRPFFVQTYYIPSGSMRPTLRENDHILVNKWVYRGAGPARGEVIVFRAPREASPTEKEFIKRVVGVPGDIIEVREGYVTVGTARYTRNDIRHALGGTVAGLPLEAATDAPPLRLTPDAIVHGGARLTPEEFAARVRRPGQPVRIVPGVVLRNGVALVESGVAEDPQYRVPRTIVPPGHYFVLGDNRNYSDDSHRWGTLPAARIVGRAEYVFWPPSRLGRVGGGE